jgi:hypothetical protein
VRMTLTVASSEVKGLYFYATQLRDIHLEGRIVDGKRLSFNEFDQSGHATASFDGEFLEQDPRGKLKGNLGCSFIAGSWSKAGSTATLPFQLKMDSGTYGTLTQRYEVAGAADDNLIHRNALRFWQAVGKGDKPTVASLVTFPIKVRISGVSRGIRSRQELISNYDAIFTPVFRGKIGAALPRNMFVRDQGIMLGNGEVWFDANGKVIAVNN